MRMSATRKRSVFIAGINVDTWWHGGIGAVAVQAELSGFFGGGTKWQNTKKTKHTQFSFFAGWKLRWKKHGGRNTVHIWIPKTPLKQHEGVFFSPKNILQYIAFSLQMKINGLPNVFLVVSDHLYQMWKPTTSSKWIDSDTRIGKNWHVLQTCNIAAISMFWVFQSSP